MPKITLWFLQASRCIRTAWLLEELGLDYEVKFAPRENGLAPPQFRKDAGGLGKFPTLDDGDLRLGESGTIAEYLCDTYDKDHKLLAAPGDQNRYKQLQWIHASEATWALHGLAILYARWRQVGGDVEQTEEAMATNIRSDMSYLEAELKKSPGKFLFGDTPTAADTMMHFSAVFILKRELGMKGQSYPGVEKFIKDCEATATYKKAVEKTGHQFSWNA